MFIVCSNCEFKYLVNSADLKPNGRMVECANCNHQWFQELDDTDITTSVPSTKKEELDQNIKNTGAYGKVMSSNYNSRPLPSEILVHNDNYAIIYSPEKIEKTIEADIIPSWL